MKKQKISRRQFLSASSAVVAGAALGGSGKGVLEELSAEPKKNKTGKSEKGEKIVYSYCDVCFMTCGIKVTVKDGVATKIEGNEKHPLSRGMLCPRGTAGLGQLYDKDRLKNPLMRTSFLGHQYFKEVSWDEALTFIAKKMKDIKKKHGAQALGLLKHGKGGKPWVRLWHAIGSKTESHPSFAQCRGPRDVGWMLTFGDAVGSPERLALDKLKTIAFIGGHLGENMHNITVQDYTRGLQKGAKNIVVDPRFSKTAAKAKYWLPIKPGTDIALLLAWMNVIISEGLYDKKFIKKHTTGFPELKEHVKTMTPEWASSYTGLSPEAIRETALELGKAAPHSLVYPGRHYSWYGDDAQRARAVAILNAMLGNWGREDGIFIGDKFKVPRNFPKSHHKGKKAFEQTDRYPFAPDIPAQDILSACIPGRYDSKKPKEALVKGLITYSTNLPYTVPNGNMVAEAAQHLDLFVAIDTMPAEVTGYADVVLPDTTYLERYDVLSNPRWREPYVAIRQPVVKPLYNTKPTWWIAKELAKKLDLGEHFPYNSYGEIIDKQLKGIGSSIADINKKSGVLKKKSKKKKLKISNALAGDKVALFSQALADAGHDPIPRYVEPTGAPAGFYRLIFGRASQHTFTRTTNNSQLLEVFSENSVWVNPKIAKIHGLVNGKKVVLMNQGGSRSTPILVRVTERIREDCLYMVHGFGRKDRRLSKGFGKGASDNELITEYEVDAVMGGTGHHVNFVTFVV